jgi:hypothetical protein
MPTSAHSKPLFSPTFLANAPKGSREFNKQEIHDIDLASIVFNPNKEILNGLAEVACFMDWSIGKLRKFIRWYGFPCASPTGKGGTMVCASKIAIRQWQAENHLHSVVKNNWDGVDCA